MPVLKGCFFCLVLCIDVATLSLFFCRYEILCLSFLNNYVLHVYDFLQGTCFIFLFYCAYFSTSVILSSLLSYVYVIFIA